MAILTDKVTEAAGHVVAAAGKFPASSTLVNKEAKQAFQALTKSSVSVNDMADAHSMLEGFMEKVLSKTGKYKADKEVHLYNSAHRLNDALTKTLAKAFVAQLKTHRS